ncbi:MAG TPA: histidine kinase, partial [Microlunatus sp.]
RDLHDILGHSLTAISIKSGLAARLADKDPAAAKVQMTEVEEIARVVLADVRATTTGMRQVRLASELASARSVLMAAGVEAVTPTALPTLTDECSELLGYVVREAVTNVVRHAEATRCVIKVGDHSVEITDDGVGIGSRRSGSGLTGLRRRVTDAGGTFAVATPEVGGTAVRAEWSATATKIKPAAGPGSSQMALVSSLRPPRVQSPELVDGLSSQAGKAE